MDVLDAEVMTCTSIEIVSVDGSQKWSMTGEDLSGGKLSIITATIDDEQGAYKLASDYTPTATAEPSDEDNAAGPRGTRNAMLAGGAVVLGGIVLL